MVHFILTTILLSVVRPDILNLKCDKNWGENWHEERAKGFAVDYEEAKLWALGQSVISWLDIHGFDENNIADAMMNKPNPGSNGSIIYVYKKENAVSY